jgi:hypothetical protein
LVQIEEEGEKQSSPSRIQDLRVDKNGTTEEKQPLTTTLGIATKTKAPIRPSKPPWNYFREQSLYK